MKAAALKLFCILLFLSACSGANVPSSGDTNSNNNTNSTADSGSTSTASEKSLPHWWQPRPGTTWQIQFSGTLNLSLDVEMYDLDLFDTPASIIAQLHAQGRKVICYFSAGSWEDWRPDANKFPESVKGKGNGWPGEKYLDIRQIEILGPLMQARMDLAVSKQCDGVDPDNVSAYDDDSGFPLTYSDQIAYNRWLAHEAHARNLSIGLKNDLEQIGDLVSYFDFAINEQCFQYNECELLLPFIQSNKAVFGVEYQGSPSVFCPQANQMNFDFLFKDSQLGSSYLACR